MTLRRSAATAWALIVGAVRRVRGASSWPARREAIETADVISLDVFDTLLLKAPGFDRRIFAAISGKARSLLVDISSDQASAPRERLMRVHRELAAAAVEKGLDPAISRRAWYEAFFRSFQALPPANGVEDLLQYEVELHRDLTTPNPEILEVVELCRSLGKRIIAISDTYFEADQLSELLRMHGFPKFDAIYASCDAGYSKFRGGLFDYVLAREGVPPERLLHIGDDRFADVYSPRSRGIRGIHYPGRGGRFEADKGFRFGYDVLGPIFASFCHLLLLEAKRQGLSRLAFIARDGEFLREATARLIAGARFLPKPRLDYVFLSRRAAALSARAHLDRAAVEEVAGIRAGGRIEDLFFEYFGLEQAVFAGLAERAGARSLYELLDDSGFREFVERERSLQRNLLADYLRQEELFTGGGYAFVDIGWRGSTQRFLSEAFGGDTNFVAPRFLYLALWSEYGPLPALDGAAVGILGDQRRSRRMRESAAWHLAFLIEAVCRASHGTVVGFERETGGSIRPRFGGDSKGRRAEVSGEPGRDAIRRGILDYIGRYGASADPSVVDEKAIRRRAQRRMLRLGFFPRRWELEAVAELVQTEGHAANWSAPLVSRNRVHPLRSPRRWMGGLTSPWRGGYVAVTGGYVFSFAFFFLEFLLTGAPFDLRRRLRNRALKGSR